MVNKKSSFGIYSRLHEFFKKREIPSLDDIYKIMSLQVCSSSYMGNLDAILGNRTLSIGLSASEMSM